MTYVRGAKRQSLEALRTQQRIAAAELELAERELAELSKAEQELARTRRRQEQINAQLAEARNRLNTPRTVLLPPPVHGGRAGLVLATREAAGWDKAHNPKRRRQG